MVHEFISQRLSQEQSEDQEDDVVIEEDPISKLKDTIEELRKALLNAEGQKQQLEERLNKQKEEYEKTLKTLQHNNLPTEKQALEEQLLQIKQLFKFFNIIICNNRCLLFFPSML